MPSKSHTCVQALRIGWIIAVPTPTPVTRNVATANVLTITTSAMDITIVATKVMKLHRHFNAKMTLIQRRERLFSVLVSNLELI